MLRTRRLCTSGAQGEWIKSAKHKRRPHLSFSRRNAIELVRGFREEGGGEKAHTKKDGVVIPFFSHGTSAALCFFSVFFSSFLPFSPAVVMVLLCALPSQASNTGGAAGVGGTTATVSLLVKETEQGGRQPPLRPPSSPALTLQPVKCC